MAEPRPFSFCIAGVQKAATSSLSAMLDRHRMIQAAPRKEMHLFDQEDRDWSTVRLSDYTVPAKRARHQLVGDATPLYLWWPQGLERIHRYNPEMKVIAVFRDPLERLFSQWVMVANRWPDKARDWPEFLTWLAPDGLQDRIPEGLDVHAFRMHSGVVRGYYGAQLAKALRIFGPDQVRVLEFRALLADHRAALDTITDFLGIHRYHRYPELPHAMAGHSRAAGTAPTGDDIRTLVERYRDDFAEFRELSGLEVSHWPIQRILAGELAPEELAATFARKVVAPPERPGG